MRNAPWLADTAGDIFPIRKERPSEPHWFSEDEGALSVDVHEYADALVVRAPIAGVKASDLDLSLHNDMLTVRGKRTAPEAEEGAKILHQECHWGPFSRSIILPVSVRADEASASLRDGILSVNLPKASRHGSIPLKD